MAQSVWIRQDVFFSNRGILYILRFTNQNMLLHEFVYSVDIEEKLIEIILKKGAVHSQTNDPVVGPKMHCTIQT